MTTPTPEAIEAAAQALDSVMNDDACPCHSCKAHYTHLAAAALTAAAPFIAAKAQASPRARVLDEVAAERDRQDIKWGEQNHPNGTGPSLVWAYRGPADFVRDTARAETDRLASEGHVTFMDILLEEVAEAFAESAPDTLRTELIQVAAVATQWIEAIDRATTIEGSGA